MDQWRHRGKWLNPSVARSSITYRFRWEVNWWIDGRGCERLPSINFHAADTVEPRNPGSARQKPGALLTKHHAQIIRNEKVAPLTDVRISVTVRPTNRADPCDQ